MSISNSVSEDIQRQIIVWPWNLGQGSFKFIGNGTIRLIVHEFLLVFNSNYAPILYHFRDKAIYWSKIVIFLYLTCTRCPRRGWPHHNFTKMFSSGKNRTTGLPYAEETMTRYIKPFQYNTRTWQTDRIATSILPSALLC